MSGQRSITLPQSHKKNTFLSKTLSKNVAKPTKRSLGKVVLVWGIALALTLPIFRSGLKENLTLWQWYDFW